MMGWYSGSCSSMASSRKRAFGDSEDKVNLDLTRSVSHTDKEHIKALPDPTTDFSVETCPVGISDTLDANPRPSALAPPPGLVHSKALIKSQIPPRPKPPVPSDYFVYPKRSWRSMSKVHIRIHILDRYGARQRYITAYQEWEEKHNKWVFGIYYLVRTVTKFQRQNMGTEAGAEPIVEMTRAVQEDVGERTTTATDVLGDLDVDMQTALTVLQEMPKSTNLIVSNGGGFKLHSKIAQIRARMNVAQCRFWRGWTVKAKEHLDPEARVLGDAMVHQTLLSGQGECSMSNSEEEDDDVEETGLSPSWRIYSDQCECGYAGCHCRTWTKWWDKTLQMLKHVMLGNVLGGPPVRCVRLSIGGRHELVEQDPPVRSLHQIKSSRVKKLAWSYKEFENLKANPPRYYLTRVTGPTLETQDNEKIITLGMQRETRGLLQMNSEDYTSQCPNALAEYPPACTETMCQKTERYLPQSVLPSAQWPSRNRALQLVAYIQYTYRLPSEIFSLAINLLDRYTTRCEQVAQLNGPHWDLLGFTCLWLAWKYENYTSVPPLDDIITYCPLQRLVRSDVIHSEWAIRNTIGIDLSYTSPLPMMRLSLTARECTKETRYIAKFLAESSALMPQLMRCPPFAIGLTVAWLACLLSDVPLADHISQNAHDGGVEIYNIAMRVTTGILNMPQSIERPREQALFYKWTLPIVNNVAGWCRSVFASVWPDWANDNDTLPYPQERIPELRAMGRSRPFKLVPGPSPGHALFEE
ncbi:Cyclin, N-terminal domain [Rhizoctonia solani]|uniref:Cyclin, N-terminal domain n=1 Tax=Rhizoctonia solani TaxID=456999 RepID=A0A8H8P099_9AGAM|nr:Cyclin, N-terminal domain [Rhizoctonia solani]QRW23356.1 Cyclin, N-terminal domain [Rhizoctonia solani]